MTDEEFAEWGRRENQLRLTEMANVQSKADLKAMQKAVASRRKSIGLSAGRAAFAVVVGQRMERGESLAFAMRRR